MFLTIKDADLVDIAIVENHESIIWTDRYDSFGDFELVIPMASGVRTYIQPGYYLANSESDHLMIIENIQIDSDAEEGTKLTISGRSLESILDRRIVWEQVTFDGNLQDAVETLLNNSIISPTNTDRQISNFIFEASTDTAITALTIKAQYPAGEDLYFIISQLCAERDLGFEVILNSSDQFVFRLYKGSDRSYDQTTNPFVIFSPSFDNLSNSKYLYSEAGKKNVSLIGGEGEGSDRVFTTVGTATGLARREIFTDAYGVSSKTSEGTLSESEYLAELQQRGNENLKANSEATFFDGQIESRIMFTPRIDFFIGDIVQIEDEYENQTKVRIVEFIMSENKEGITLFPTCKQV